MDPQPGESSDDQPVMISQRMKGRGTSQTGTWVAAGAIDDEGDARCTHIESTPQDDGTRLISATFVLVSGDDPDQMITLRDRSTLQPFPAPEPQHRVLTEGTWRVTSGTKAYADLRGRGKLYSTGTDRGVDDQGRPDREVTMVRDGVRQR